MKKDEHAYFLDLIKRLRSSGYQPGEVAAGLDEIESWIANKTEDPASPQVQNAAILNDQVFRNIVDGSSIGIAIFEKGKTIYANTKLFDMFQLDPHDPKLNQEKFFCDRASQRTAAIMEDRDKMMERGVENIDPFTAEFTLDDGKEIFFEIHSKPLNTQAGLWRICFMIDVTKDIETRVEMAQRTHRYESILNGTDAGTWEWNLSTNQGQYNDKWAEMLGYDPADLRALSNGDTWSFAISDEDKPLADRLVFELLEGRTDILQFEARLRHREGNMVWVHSRGRITDWDPEGRPLILSGTVIDITEKKVAEQNLLRAKEELEGYVTALSIASHAKENFLSTMSHEIRTPLNAVIGLANLLLRRTPRPDQLEIVKTLKNSSDNLLHLVNDILDYNKIQAGKLQLESVRFNFRDFVEHIYSTFKLDAQDRGLNLQVTADPRIPDALEGDITRLNQILINLLSNAMKFTAKGEVSLDVSLVSLEEGECTIRFVVNDTGIGVHPSKLNKIFEPFHQSDASITRQYGGTGLGLSIVKALVKVFDGTIVASSLPGRGSSFAVQLRLREASLTPVDPWSRNWELPFGRRQIRVLYVEDVESNRFLVKTLMEEFHLMCTIAATGREALEKTLVEKFDIILMDIQMPDMDGYQAAQRIFSQAGGRNTTTPIVAFTAEPVTDTLRAKLSQHHMLDVISKPFDIDQFMEKISFLSSGSDSEQEYSFAFYSRATVSDNTSQIMKIVADEIESFTVALFETYHNNDLVMMRKEIHKLHPIIKNLKMGAVSMLLEQLRSYDKIDPEMLDIINVIKIRINSVAADLRRAHAEQER